MTAQPLALAAALALLTPLSAHAATPMVGFVDPDFPTCFARAYSADHMAKNPRQRVTGIVFTYVPTRSVGGGRPERQWDANGGRPFIHATILVRMKGMAETLMGGVSCEAKAGRLVCGIEGDAGTFTLGQHEAGVRLENPDRFTISPATGDMDRDQRRSVTIDARDDHRVFLLPAAQGGLCDAERPKPRP